LDKNKNILHNLDADNMEYFIFQMLYSKNQSTVNKRHHR